MKPISILLLLISPGFLFAEEPANAGAQTRTSHVKLNFTAFAPAPVVAADGQPVIVLPKFEVHDVRIRLAERDVVSAQELLAQAKARYLTSVYQKTFGQLSAALGMIANLPSILGGWHPNDAEASALFAQDERLRRIHESNDLLHLVERDDLADYKDLKDALDGSFRRETPWRPHPAE